MLRDIIEGTASYIQYMMLLFQISPSSFPSFFTSSLNVLNYVNLDLLAELSSSTRYKNSLNVPIPPWIPLDFRLQFVMVAILGPLLIALLGTFFLATKPFFLWFVFLLAGSFVLIVTVTATVNANLVQGQIFSRDEVAIAMYCGVAVTGMSVLTGLLVVLWQVTVGKDLEEQEKRTLAQVVNREKNDVDAAIELQMVGAGASSTAVPVVDRGESGRSAESGAGSASDTEMGDAAMVHERLDHIMQIETEELDVAATVTRGMYFLVFFFTGLIFARVFNFSIFAPVQSSNLFYALSGVILMIAAVILCWFLLGLVRAGREMQFEIGVWTRDNFVSVLLLLLSVIYTPAVTNVISMYSCEEVTCSAGYHLPIPQSAMMTKPLSVFNSVSGSSACFACNFSAYSQQCPPSLQMELCGVEATASRLSNDVNVACSSVGTFFVTAATIMLASFVISLPMLYFVLTSRSTRTVELEFPLDPRQTEGYTDEDRYNEKLHLTENVAKFIYDPFSRSYRHWRIVVLAQKIMIVVIAVTTRGDGPVSLTRSGGMGLGLSLLVHMAYLAYVVYTRPFLRKVENTFTGTAQTLLCLVCLIGICRSSGLTVPYAVEVFEAVLVVGGPVVALIVGAVLTFRDDVLQQNEREERVRVAQQQAEGDASMPSSEAASPVHRKSIRTGGGGGGGDGRGDGEAGGVAARSQSAILSSASSSPLASSALSFPSGARSTNAASHALLPAGHRSWIRHSRPKFSDIGTVTHQRIALKEGNVAPLSRYHTNEKAAEFDASNRRTLVSTLRRRGDTAVAASGALVRHLSFSNDTTNASTGRDAVGGEVRTELTGWARMPAGSGGTTGGGGGSGGGGSGGVKHNSGGPSTMAKSLVGKGAAAEIIKRNARKNTAEESSRAKKTWLVARQAILAFVREETAEAERQQRTTRESGGARKKSFFVKSGAQKVEQGKKWDNFLAQLMVDETDDAVGSTQPAPQRLPSWRNPSQRGAAVGNGGAGLESASSPNGRSRISDADGSSAAADGGGNRHGASGASPQSKDDARKELLTFDPIQRAKEKRKQKLVKLQQFMRTGGADVHAADSGDEGALLESSGAFQNVSGVFGQESAPVVEDVEDQYRSIQGGAAGRRRHIQLRLKLQALYERQLRKLELTQQAVDFRVNRDTIRILNHFFVFLGMFALVALSLATIGAISTMDTTFYTGVTFNSDLATSTQFVGYHTWDNFTAHCCCVASADREPVWPYYIVDLEEWLCDNGNIKERIRKAYIDGVLSDGYSVRGLCGYAFDNGCSANVSTAGGASIVNISGCNRANVSIVAETMLW